mgnify:CR=1 FL=1
MFEVCDYCSGLEIKNPGGEAGVRGIYVEKSSGLAEIEGGSCAGTEFDGDTLAVIRVNRQAC